MGTFDTLGINRVKASGVNLAVDVVASGNTVLIANTATLGAEGGLSMVLQLSVRDFIPWLTNDETRRKAFFIVWIVIAESYWMKGSFDLAIECF